MIVTKEIPPLGLREFYTSLGLIRYMEPDTEDLMVERAEREWRGADIARGEFWATSYHASSFPGDDPDPCQRLLAYTMMDFASAEPMPPWVTATGDVGKAVEMSIVRAWYEGGRSLIVPEDIPGGGQLVFIHEDHWMSGSVDLPVLKKGWRKPHICEIKCKDGPKVIEKMQAGERKWDEAHRRQVLATLGLANRHDWGSVLLCGDSWRIARDGNPFLGEATKVCREHGGDDCLIWIDLAPPDTASLYYADRSWPRKTVEYAFDYDPAYLEQGLVVLDQVRDHFIRDEIPPRPDHFQWSLGKCRFCDFKKNTCKPDFIKRTQQEKLSESNGISWTREVRENYDPEVARRRVLDRWTKREGNE